MKTHGSSSDQLSGFPPGTLWERLCAASARARRERALEPIDTQSSTLSDHCIPFLVRIVASLRKKPPGTDDRNPFLPYEQALYVADASPTHVCILNKYNVVDLHLLIITKHFEHQETLLTLPDFRALWRCLIEYDSLGFYNSGTTSGASQKHKHLQLVPLPLVPGENAWSVPLEPLIETGAKLTGHIQRIADLPFAHALVHWGPLRTTSVEQLARQSLATYLQLLRQVGIPIPPAPGTLIVRPYNLLVSRRWMLLVPRTHECFQSISFNSLAFAGALLVQDETQLARLRHAGPMAALAYVAQPDE